MTKITAKEVRAAASSVAGARGMGIETDASRAAPELLARAEAALRAISGRADDIAELACYNGLGAMRTIARLSHTQ